MKACTLSEDELNTANAICAKALSKNIDWNYNNVETFAGSAGEPNGAGFYYPRLEGYAQRGHARSVEALRRISRCPRTASANMALLVLEKLKQEKYIETVYEVTKAPRVARVVQHVGETMDVGTLWKCPRCGSESDRCKDYCVTDIEKGEGDG